MKLAKKLISEFLILFLLIVFAASCTQNYNISVNSTQSSTALPTSTAPAEEYTLEKEPGHKQLTLYWNYSGSYDKCDIWIWWDGKEGSGYPFYKCEYGAKVIVNVPDSIEQVGFIVRRDCSEPGGNSWGSATKDFGEDRFAVLEGEETFIYLKSGVGSQYISNDGGKTLDIIKKFTLAAITEFNKIQYNITPAKKLTSFEQVKVYQDDKQGFLSFLAAWM